LEDLEEVINVFYGEEVRIMLLDDLECILSYFSSNINYLAEKVCTGNLVSYITNNNIFSVILK